MEPVSAALLSTFARAILTRAGDLLLSSTAARKLKARVFGDPEHRALERALQRAFEKTRGEHGLRLAEYDANFGFFEREGADELAKMIVPGMQPSAVRLAECCLDSLGHSPSYDVRWDRVNALRPAFQMLLDTLNVELRQEPTFRDLMSYADTMAVADVMKQLARHHGAAPATGDDEVSYLGWLVDQHRYVRTTGVVRKTTVQLPLAEVFVGLSAHRDPHPGDRVREWFERKRASLAAMRDAGRLDPFEFEAALDRLYQQCGRKFPTAERQPAAQILPALEAVRTIRHLLVLGDPGSGKTTLLRYLALVHAQAMATGATIDGRAPLFPIYLRIGDYARWPHAGGISEFLPEYLHSLECRTPGLADLLNRRLDRGGCLVLLDGLDEIGSAEQRQSVVAAVANFATATARPGNRIVVTSRISGYLAAPLPEPFAAVRLQEMDDATVERFLKVYCREVERAETPHNSRQAIVSAGLREASAIGQALRANPGVRRLAANPLLLTALVLVHRASGRLPHRRVEAYVEVCNALGRTWRSVQGVSQPDLPDERQLTRWLTELGAWIHEHRPEGSVTKLELLEVLGPLWATHRGIDWDPRVLRAADPLDTDAGIGVLGFVYKAEQHTGLVVERAPGRYGFTHLTFEEYYAARALAFRGDAAERAATIRAHLHDPRWNEPILLALGLVGTDYAEQVESLVAEAVHPGTPFRTAAAGTPDHRRDPALKTSADADLPSASETLLGRDFLFMLRVLADDIPLETVTIDAAVNQALDEWFAPASGRGRFTSYRDALASHLVDLGSTTAARRLHQALDNRAVTARHETPVQLCQLAAAIAPHMALPAATASALTELATTADDPLVQVQAVAALASGGTLTDKLVATAVRLATTATDSAVRERAVAALASGPVVTALVELATGTGTGTGTDPGIRGQAIAALGNLFRTGSRPRSEHLPGTDLEAVPTSGGAPGPVRPVRRDSPARRPVTSGSGPQGEVADPVVTALVELATTTDADPGIRSQAIAALASGGTLTNPVITAAVELATTTDADPGIRSQAIAALASGGTLTNPVITALVELATTTDADPGIRSQAIAALASGRAPTDPVVTALTGLATTAIDPWVRVKAVAALAANGTLTDPVIAAAQTLATTTDADPGVQVRAVEALAANGTLTGPVSIALGEVATSAADPWVRVRAVEALAANGTLTDPVIAAAQTLATTTDADPRVQVRAVEALASNGTLTGPVTAATVRLATANEDPWIQVQAVAVLAANGTLTDPIVTIAVRLATTATDPWIRVQAVEALASNGTLTDRVVAGMIEHALEEADWRKRQLAVGALRHATPTPRIRAVLMSFLRDADNDVRRTAGNTLVALAVHHPEIAKDITADLVAACEDPAFEQRDEIKHQTGWDYAYDALLSLVQADNMDR